MAHRDCLDGQASIDFSDCLLFALEMVAVGIVTDNRSLGILVLMIKAAAKGPKIRIGWHHPGLASIRPNARPDGRPQIFGEGRTLLRGRLSGHMVSDAEFLKCSKDNRSARMRIPVSDQKRHRFAADQVAPEQTGN